MSELKRAVTITEGVAMVVTDLHGNGKVYDHLRDQFLAAYEAGMVQRFVICGDLIHGNRHPNDDDSLRMLLDVMRLQKEMGRDTVIMLCGNHEMPHIYGMPLARGNKEYTPRFEASLAALDQDDSIPSNRSDVIEFLMDLPFYMFTAAGVMLAHAGPAQKLTDPTSAGRILNFDHRAYLADIDAKLAQYDLKNARDVYAMKFDQSYDELARHYLAVEDESDPRYEHLLRSFAWNGDPDFDLLWDALFTRNEDEFPNDMRRAIEYGNMVKDFLSAMSTHVPAYPQHIVVSGHIVVRGGHTVVEDNHLRIASYEHARPQNKGQYLLLDCSAPPHKADSLVAHLRPTFD